MNPFNLDTYLAERRRFIEEKLLASLGLFTEATPETLLEPMRYALLTPGKRLRPIFCLAAAEAAGSDVEAAVEAALPAALAIEYLHAYTLVHDDLPGMDNDRERRGQPTVWAKFGEATAILTGDALHAAAFTMIASAGTSKTANRQMQILWELAFAAGPGGVIAGQMLDLANIGTTDAATITQVHSRKTAYLFASALVMGAIAAKAPRSVQDNLRNFGGLFGLAFQITDDLLDGVGDEKKELSILNAVPPEKARETAARLIKTALRHLDGFDAGRAAPLRAIAEMILTRTV